MTQLKFMESLEAVIKQRLETAPEGSYTAELARQGVSKVAQKLGEEAVEVVLASVVESDTRLKEESADLLYHLVLLLTLRGIPLADVVAELEKRHREKTSAPD